MVLEVDEVGGEDVVVDDLVGGLGEEEIKLSVVFTAELLVDWLCINWATSHCVPGGRTIHQTIYIFI